MIKEFKFTPFKITCDKLKNKPGTWDSTKVSILRNNKVIGEYIRNYDSFSENTFYPFKYNEEWYALYSVRYTATRVMKLHNDRIEDWCGEEPHSNGFCPVEYFVPKYIKSEDSYLFNGEEKKFVYYNTDAELSDDEFLDELNNPEALESSYCNFGFLCGCVWGDDTSWKIRYIDLSKLEEKVLLITDKFGYWELPRKLSLKQCVDLDNWEPNHPWITLIGVKHINISTGEHG